MLADDLDDAPVGEVLCPHAAPNKCEVAEVDNPEKAENNMIEFPFPHGVDAQSPKVERGEEYPQPTGREEYRGDFVDEPVGLFGKFAP